MADVVSIIREAAVQAVSMLSISKEQENSLVAYLVQRATKDPSVLGDFLNELGEKKFMGQPKGNPIPIEVGVTAELLPSMPTPTIIRERYRPAKVPTSYAVDANFKEFMNSSYGDDADITYTDTTYHDHPNAALSRAVETEVVCAYMRSHSADFLRKPVDGYDFSVIDVGANWQTHMRRGHHGVHSDSPLLDARDISREARRSIQVSIDTESIGSLCRDTLQDCKVTAPFATSIHANYDISQEDTVKSMMRRGIKVYAGSMHVPEQLINFSGHYQDKHYKFNIDTVREGVSGAYIPPHMRRGVGKYFIGADTGTVRYTFTGGNSKSYVHDLKNLQSYLTPRTFTVADATGKRVDYQYEIWRRVGSLIYFSFKRVGKALLQNEVTMTETLTDPFDGYLVTVDDVMFAGGSMLEKPREVKVPRYLFNTVAEYCLTQVTSDNYTVNSIISYVGSVMSQLDFNGVRIHNLSPNVPEELRLATAVAAFQWAADRYQLIVARVPELQEFKDRSMSGFDPTSIASSMTFLKSKAIDKAGQIVLDQLSGLMMSGDSNLEVVEDVIKKIRNVGNFGLKSIVDCRHRIGSFEYIDPIESFFDTALRIDTYDLHATVMPVYDNTQTEAGDVVTYQEVAAEYTNYSGSTLVGSEIVPYTGKIFVKDDSQDDDAESTTSSVEELSPVLRAEKVLHERAVDAVRDYVRSQLAGQTGNMQGAFAAFDSIFRNTDKVNDLTYTRDFVGPEPMVLRFEGGLLMRIITLTTVYEKGTESFNELLARITKFRFIFPYVEGPTRVMRHGTITETGNLRIEKKKQIGTRSFDAIHFPKIDVLNSQLLEDLPNKVRDAVPLPLATFILHDEVAGSGKTHQQVERLIKALKAMETEDPNWIANHEATVKRGDIPRVKAVILANTRSAAEEARERVAQAKINGAEYCVYTVDAYIMNPKYWVECDLLMLDEVLQMHQGKIFCALYCTRARELRGYGDEKQIKFINFAKDYRMNTKADFPWSIKQVQPTTRRLPVCSAIKWLREPAFYGSTFSTQRDVQGWSKRIVLNKIGAISVSSFYDLFGIKKKEQLLLMVYTQDEAAKWRANYGYGHAFPSKEEVDAGKFNLAIRTIGEAQGADADNACIFRDDPKGIELYTNAAQSLVGLTRFKKRFVGICIYTTHKDYFANALDEKFPPESHSSFESAIASFKTRDLFAEERTGSE